MSTDREHQLEAALRRVRDEVGIYAAALPDRMCPQCHANAGYLAGRALRLSVDGLGEDLAAIALLGPVPESRQGMDLSGDAGDEDGPEAGA